MIEKENCTEIGTLVKSHGVRGEVSISLNDGIYAGDFESKFLLLDIEDGLVPFYIENIRHKSNKNILVKLSDIKTEDKVLRLINTDIYIPSVELLVDDKQLTSSFTGFAVHDTQKGDIGIITDIQKITNNPLFEIDCDGKEILIPVNPDFILSVDKENKIVNMSLPEGLIDMFLSDNDDDIDFEIPEE